MRGLVLGALWLTACSAAHGLGDAGSDSATDDLRTLAVDAAQIAALAIDSHDTLCALVNRSNGVGRALVYGCFEDAFVERGVLATTSSGSSPSVVRFVLDAHDDPSALVAFWGSDFVVDVAGESVADASCWLRFTGGAVASVCVPFPLALFDVAFDATTGRSAAIVWSPEGGAMLDGVALPFGSYLVDGIADVSPEGVHGFTRTNDGPVALIADGDGGWVIAGSYWSPLDDAWGLPASEGQSAFTMRLDASLAPTASHISPSPSSAQQVALDGSARAVTVVTGFSDDPADHRHSLVVEGRDPVPFGNGAQLRSMAVRGVVAAVFDFAGGGETMTFGTTTLPRNVTALVTLSLAGEVLAVRALPPGTGNVSNVVLFADDTIAVARGSVVHVLSPR